MNTNRHHPKDSLPGISAAVSRTVDQVAMSKYGVPGIVLMENAARGTADLLLELYSPLPEEHDPSFVIVCGKGNNGGDGWAIARQLVTRGLRISLYSIPNADELTGDAAINCQIALQLNLDVSFADGASPQELLGQLNDKSIVVDAMLGTGIKGSPRAPYAEWIQYLNESSNPIVAVDIPSGLDADTGLAEIAISAEHTCTFVRPKNGLLLKQGPSHCGEIHVLDIGVPDSLVAEAERNVT